MDIDFNFIGEIIPTFIQGTIMTVKLAVVSIILSIIIGLLIETARYFNLKILTIISKVYIEFSRNTPLLIQVFFSLLWTN